jgi:hypothetical protein
MYECSLARWLFLLQYCLVVAESASLKAGKDISRFYATPCFYFPFLSTLAESKFPQRSMLRCVMKDELETIWNAGVLT